MEVDRAIPGLHDPCGRGRCVCRSNLFMPDGGTARADFPGGDAHELYRSTKKVLSLPREMRLPMCHAIHRGDGRFAGKPVSVKRGKTIFMFKMACLKTSLSQCVRLGTDPWHAETHHPVDPGQYPGQTPAAGRVEILPESSCQSSKH